MLPGKKNSLHLFRFAGIDVYLHWSWFVFGVYEVQSRRAQYGSLVWNACEYLSVFLIVLLHEFGHSLACRQVGGKADQIILWPLGGVAFVAPPPRPGATLWSIAAGPLVNVILAPILIFLWFITGFLGWTETSSAYLLVRNICLINLVVLCFNLLPIYPLDGGQILRSLLWFWLGRARSLMVSAFIGFAGVGLLGLMAVLAGHFWFAVIAVFILLNCWRGLTHARVLSKLARMPRRPGFACPACKTGPVMGKVWVCYKCGTRFDTFESHATCPGCGEQFATTICFDCGEARPFAEWVVGPPAVSPSAPPILG